MWRICARCEKVVCPTEEVKCLNKYWHKLCFKCWECGMLLNVKNYRGCDNKPYCEAHNPHIKLTDVAETTEMQRLTQMSNNPSQVKYHEDYEENIEGSKIQVIDEPETQCFLQLGTVVSQAEFKVLNEVSTWSQGGRTY